MTMNMIEKVARAISPDAWTHFDAYCRLKGLDEAEIAEKREQHATIKSSISAARASIEAMRTATPEMYRAGIEANVGPRSTAHGYIYEAMISEALKE